MSRRGFALVPVLALVVATAGCVDTNQAEARGGVLIENCGTSIRVEHPPARAVAADQETTEILLALGLRDRIAGTALQIGPVAPEFRADYERLRLLNPKNLTAEQLRAANPDFVASAVTSDFSRDGVGTRQELAELGVASYASAVDCPQFLPDTTPFDRLLVDYDNYGKIFGVADRAAELTRRQRKVIADAQSASAARRTQPRVVYLYSVYNDGLPYVAGNSGMPQDMSRILRAPNAFEDLGGDWAEVGWEEIAARNPSVIVLADLPDRGLRGDKAAQKIEILREHPVISQLTAVRENRFITVPGLELDPTVGSVNALREIKDGLQRLG
ncbi:iron complex transport system substrate-binding protein [Herbihabitans rhizosphaerae]|uniref:Iron complex transport system substrate-binding protein n=1 Tax=Herbihabitans rhizosphaerae TaxID=1872711 RepID=A0A4V2ERK4_9PSEU|nr:ABC transporter substrate-binding protein [Herbihabitans rhizosphaerae]RZS32259.1 iron complex transport system substrate-binding protein [Herbihabitans rhizosphaerae]